jgi:hypothetical protein
MGFGDFLITLDPSWHILFGLVAGVVCWRAGISRKRKRRKQKTNIKVTSENTNRQTSSPFDTKIKVLQDQLQLQPGQLKFEGSDSHFPCSLTIRGLVPKGISACLNKGEYGSNAFDKFVIDTFFKGSNVKRLPWDSVVTIQSDGVIRIVSSGSGFSAEMKEEFLEHVARMAKYCHQNLPDKIPNVLLNRVRDQNHAMALRVLCLHFRDASATRKALDYANDSKSDGLRVMALSLASPESNEGLTTISCSENVSSEHRKQATNELMRRADIDALLRIFEARIDGYDLELVPMLAKAGKDQIEDALLGMLKTAGDQDTVIIADGLARIGSLEAIMALKEKAESISDQDAELSVVVAIDRIQKRCSGGSLGGLAVVEDEAEKGQLSLNHDQKGRLAMSQKTKN